MSKVNHSAPAPIPVEPLPDFLENLIAEYEARTSKQEIEEQLPFSPVSSLLCTDCGSEVEYNSAEYLTGRYGSVLCVDCSIDRASNLG